MTLKGLSVLIRAVVAQSRVRKSDGTDVQAMLDRATAGLRADLRATEEDV